MNKKYIILSLILLLNACNGKKLDIKPDYIKTEHEKRVEEFGTVFSPAKYGESKEGNNSSLTANTYLWKSALDVISFMPIKSTDPVSGLIITDWYQVNSKSDEKFKVNIFITGRELKASNVQVKVFKQKLVNNHWVNKEASNDLAKEIEEKIIEKARELNLKNKF